MIRVMKKHISKALLCAALAAATVSMAFTGCAGKSLKTLDFSSKMTNFGKSELKSANWDRTNLITADTTTTATIEAPEGQKSKVIMLKGDAGTLKATSTTDGTLTTDKTKNSYYASATLLSGGSPAQLGDGIYKFKLEAVGCQPKVWNAAVVFKDSAPQKWLDDDSVTKALAVVVYGGDVQIWRNYQKDGATVKQDVVKDTGVNVGDSKYHYYILAVQDAGKTTNVKLYVDGNVAYQGQVDGVTGKGAVEVFQNGTPQYDASGNVVIQKGFQAGTFQPELACGEAYFGGYDDGPSVSNISAK